MAASTSAGPSTCRRIAADAGLTPENTLAAFRNAHRARRHDARDRSRGHEGRRRRAEPRAAAQSRPGARPRRQVARRHRSRPSTRSRWPSSRRYDIGRLNPATRYGQQFPAQTAHDGERFPTLAELYAMAGPWRAVQHRDQDRSDQAGRDGRPGAFRAARRRCDPGREEGEAHDDPVVRLAHPDRGQASRARDRDRLPHHRDRGT